MKKRLLILIVTIGLLISCAGFKPDVAVNMATDVAFSVAVTQHPEIKPLAVAALVGVKEFLAGDVTYDDLILEIARRFAGQYAYVGVIVADYVGADKPISETHLTLFDSYKAGLSKKIDRLILIAGM